MNTTLVNILCLLSLSVCSEARDWAFVQSAGGIALGELVSKEGNWSLAVRANVSGLETITVKPQRINSALICERTDAVVQPGEIHLTIHSGLLRDGYVPSCPNANLGKLAPGTYRVFYRSTNGELNPLGEIHPGGTPE